MQLGEVGRGEDNLAAQRSEFASRIRLARAGYRRLRVQAVRPLEALTTTKTAMIVFVFVFVSVSVFVQACAERLFQNGMPQAGVAPRLASQVRRSGGGGAGGARWLGFHQSRAAAAGACAPPACRMCLPRVQKTGVAIRF